MEWPGRNNQPDTGIDLVAQERATGDFTAIQCKFLDPSHWLQKEDIDSFFTASGKKPFTQRMIICTTDKWGKHAEEALNNQQPPVIRLRFQDLDESVIDWSSFNINRPQQIKRKPPNLIREHQKEARADVVAGFKTADRGKLIMACGTGKTFTALKIAEELVPAGGNVLFLVPSISLISQTFWEWSAQSENPLNSFAVCSDAQVGKKKTDEEDIRTYELPFPAHTNARRLESETGMMRAKEKKNLNVIFSTYQSIKVISDAQKLFGLPEFDLVICDEAHRTTGVEQTELNKSEAATFTAVHNSDFLKAKRRLYMTATPRIYTDDSKAKAKDAGVTYFSMDEEKDYGKELHRLDFSKAIEGKLLSDYKVLVLAVDQLAVSTVLQQQLAQGTELKLEDAVKIVGCWNGLRKRFVKQEGDGGEAMNRAPMRRAVAFSSRIKDSQNIEKLFKDVIKEYAADGNPESSVETDPDFLRCDVLHVDGKMNSLKRSEALQWLKADTAAEGNVCRILTNARCLSEGVDVPALDAVMFLNPRKSVVDVVQAVGRVMRKADGKDYGYIILPIAVPDGVPPEEALSNHENYKVVWQVLQALRAHDDRFDKMLNQIELNTKRPDQIQIIGVGGEGEHKDGTLLDAPVQAVLNFNLKDWQDKIFAKIVLKCGTRKYWEQWAQDVAKIAEAHVIRIRALLKSSDARYRNQFDKFLNGLRKTLNPSISEDDAIEMLSQHLITKPVFDALFEGYEFTKHNPVSKTMQKMLDILDEQSLGKERESLEKFYESVRKRASGIDNAAGRQEIIVELYQKFFKIAFEKMHERLGIVYTPVPVVDFMLKSVDDILREEFGVGLTAENVHILDPFTGTGTYIVRLIQSGLIDDQDLARKFRGELHANEIVLLAYYIAAINIEEAYHARVKKDYEPFEGIVLTDTFQLSEGAGKFADDSFQANSERAKKQNQRDIRVIVANPPYSAWQESENDDNKNLKYPQLDDKIKKSYAAYSTAVLKNSLYNSYIRAIRWASDRVKDKGIICFVSDGSFIDGNAMDGLRKCLTDEFAAIYCFNLRGKARGTSGEQRRKEKGNVFDSGSRQQIAITLLVKNLEHKGVCQLFYHDIGDYLSREEKLNIVTEFQSVKKIPWQTLLPNKNHDWINQRDESFQSFIPICEDPTKLIFCDYSGGVMTSRDAWVCNYSAKAVNQNTSRLISFYNQQLEKYQELAAKQNGKTIELEKFIDTDPKKISWSAKLKANLQRNINVKFQAANLRTTLYRPFIKQHLYLDQQFTERPGSHMEFFPNANTENRLICVTGTGASVSFSALITSEIPNRHYHDTCQCFPLYTYSSDAPKPVELKLGDAAKDGRQLNVSEFALKEFRAAYKDAKLGKEDIFYYVYGVLHSPEYKTRFAADLKKMLPRIPFAKDFWAFSRAGRDLAKIHLNYETAAPYRVKDEKSELALDESKLYLVEKMRFGKTVRTATAAPETDKTKIIYNGHITLTGIPLAAYDYIVNGKPAIEWIMDRYQLITDKDSGLTNNPNDWATEHADPAYILNLLKRIITVSMETMKIVNSLPPLHELKSIKNRNQ